MRLRRITELIGITAVFALIIALGIYWREYQLQKVEENARADFLAKGLIRTPSQEKRRQVSEVELPASPKPAIETIPNVSEASTVTATTHSAPEIPAGPSGSVDASSTEKEAPTLPEGLE